jgi:hypothetical protein
MPVHSQAVTCYCWLAAAGLVWLHSLGTELTENTFPTVSLIVLLLSNEPGIINVFTGHWLVM